MNLVNLDLENLAPISVTVYNRYNHFKQCIDSLSKNTLASYSLLYIFSDAPKPSDVEAVQMVRSFAKSISGFKQTILIFQDKNNYGKNMRDARTIPLYKHGKIIRLEDDIITSPFFLEFMNENLTFYKDNPRINAICGYLHAGFKLETNKHIMCRSINAWGLGYWAHKENLDNINLEQLIKGTIKNPYLFLKIGYNFPHIPGILLSMLKSKFFFGDIILLLLIFKKNYLCVFPSFSLTKNIGFDGSGVHCSKNENYKNQEISSEKISVNTNNQLIRNREYERFERQIKNFRFSSLRSVLILLTIWFGYISGIINFSYLQSKSS